MILCEYFSCFCQGCNSRLRHCVLPFPPSKDLGHYGIKTTKWNCGSPQAFVSFLIDSERKTFLEVRHSKSESTHKKFAIARTEDYRRSRQDYRLPVPAVRPLRREPMALLGFHSAVPRIVTQCLRQVQGRGHVG